MSVACVSSPPRHVCVTCLRPLLGQAAGNTFFALSHPGPYLPHRQLFNCAAVACQSTTMLKQLLMCGKDACTDPKCLQAKRGAAGVHPRQQNLKGSPEALVTK
eukprot:640171-Amphidinium_carterae.1